MALVDSLLPEFDHEMGTTRRLLERVPEDKIDWRPHPRSFTLGQLAQHVATIPLWGSMTLTQSELDIAAPGEQTPIRTQAGLLAHFDGHVKATRAALAGKMDAELMVPWTLKRGPDTIFSMPKVAVWRSFVLSHLIHHRGQLCVYLRMNDVPVPSIYGPSADEAVF
jgi:uncharacterized damage-inducible protein DinB